MIAAGTVASLHRWPVKSLGGEAADALRIDGRGAGGDRAQALLGIFGGKRRRLTVRQVPRMLAWAAAYPQAPGAALDPDDPPLPVITGPDGRTWDWDDPGLPGALRDDLGRPVDLARDLALMPDLPAMAETQGLEGFEVIAWVGMFAPAKTPKDVVDKLNAVVRKALAKPEVKDKIASFAAEAAPSTPDELAEFVKDQLASWGKAIKEAGIQPE